MLTVNQAISQGLVSVILDPTGVLSLHGKDGNHISNDSPGVIQAVVGVTQHISGLRRVSIADNGQIAARITLPGVAVTHTLTLDGLADGSVYSAGAFIQPALQKVGAREQIGYRWFTRLWTQDGRSFDVDYPSTIPNEVYTDFAIGYERVGYGSETISAEFHDEDLLGVDVDIVIPDAYAPCNGDNREITVSRYTPQVQVSCYDYQGPVTIVATAAPTDVQTVKVDADISAAIAYHHVGSGTLDDTWKYDIHRSQLATLQAYASDLYAYRNGETVDPVTGQPIFVDSTLSGITASTVIADRTADETGRQWTQDEIVSLQSFCMVEGLRQIADAAYVNGTINDVTDALHTAMDDFINLAAATVDSVNQVYTQRAFLTHVIQDIQTSYSTVTPIVSMNVSDLSNDSEYVNYKAMRDVNAVTCDTGGLTQESRRRGVYNAVGAYVMSMGEITGTSSAPSTIDTGIGASLIASPILSVQFKHQSDRILPFTEVFSPTVDGRTARCVIALSQIDLDVYRVDMYARHFGGDDSSVASSISWACRDLASVARGMGCTGDWTTPGGDFSAFRGWIAAAAGSIQAALSAIGLSACAMLPMGHQSNTSPNRILKSDEYRALTTEAIRQHSSDGHSLDIRLDRISVSSGQVVRTTIDPVDRWGTSLSTLKTSIVRHAGVLTGALGVASLGTALISAGLSSGSIANASWNITGEAIMQGFSMSAPTDVVGQFIPFADPKAMIAWVAKCMLTPDPSSVKPKLCLETMPMGCYLFAEQRPSAVTSIANALTTAAIASWFMYLRKYRTYTITRSPIVSPFAGAAVPATVGYGMAKATYNAMSDDPVTDAQLIEVIASYLGTPQEYKDFNVGLAGLVDIGSTAASSLNDAVLGTPGTQFREELRQQLQAILTKLNQLGEDERTYYL